MALKDHPALHTEFKKLEAQKAKIIAKAAPLRARREELRVAMEPMEVEAREIKFKIFAIERPMLADIDSQLSAIAKATGGLVLVAQGG